LGVNHFADWTQDEYEAIMLPNKDRPRPDLTNMLFDGERVKLHQPRISSHLLPSTVDYRGMPADSPVKDQAACGSCWVRARVLIWSCITSTRQTPKFFLDSTHLLVRRL
jgi:hypothetical protein